MSRVLSDMGKEYKNEAWFKASERFEEGAIIISEITNLSVNYLTGGDDRTEELPRLFAKIANIMTDGFVLLER